LKCASIFRIFRDLPAESKSKIELHHPYAPFALGAPSAQDRATSAPGLSGLVNGAAPRAPSFALRRNIGAACCRRYLVNWLPTIKLCAFIFIYLHLVTCVWHGLQVGTLSLPHERSWLDVDAPADYLESRSLVQYVTSFHVVLNINLGNGINPRNATENVFSVFNLLIGAFLFAMLFGTLAGCPVRPLAPLRL
jgi:hypothetical protein